MIEQLKQYDLYARNLFETIIYVREMYDKKPNQRGILKPIIKHLTKDINILITNDDVREAFSKFEKKSLEAQDEWNRHIQTHRATNDKW